MAVLSDGSAVNLDAKKKKKKGKKGGQLIQIQQDPAPTAAAKVTSKGKWAGRKWHWKGCKNGKCHGKGCRNGKCGRKNQGAANSATAVAAVAQPQP